MIFNFVLVFQMPKVSLVLKNMYLDFALAVWNHPLEGEVHRLININQIYLFQYVKAFRKERSIIGESMETKQISTKQ